MGEVGKFVKGFGGSMVWVFAVIIAGMVLLRFLRQRKLGIVSTVAGDAQNLATTGSVTGN